MNAMNLSNVLFLVPNPIKIVTGMHRCIDQRVANVSVPIHTVAPPSVYDKS